jgi:crotonobetainyl-CoA:carnitine CoA-transferase CaiB-like acyl-CoA transferase
MGLVKASDGWFNIGVSGAGNWRRFCEALEQQPWLRDDRFATNEARMVHREALMEEISSITCSRPMAHWVELFNRFGVPAGPVYTVPQVFEDEQVRHLGATTRANAPGGKSFTYITQPVHLARTPASVQVGAPACGEHTDEVLREAGLAEAEIRCLHAQGVVSGA